MSTDKQRRIIRTIKNKNYFTASNEAFNDKRLSFGARGIMGYLLSKPDNWEAHRRDLTNRSTDGETKVRKYLNELKKYGYLNRFKERDSFGRIKWVSEIYESPSLNPRFKQTSTTGSSTTGGFTTGGFTTGGKTPSLVNTEVVNTEVVNTDKVKTDGKTAAAEIFQSLTVISGLLKSPIGDIKGLSEKLLERGERTESIKQAWLDCQAFAFKPSGAFIYWCHSGIAPKAKKTTPPPSSAAPPPLTQVTPMMTEDEVAERLAALERMNQ